MGFSLGSIVNAVTDPGSLVKDAVNSLLPKNLAVVGDIAGAVVDFQTGHGFQAAQHAFQALKDLPQAINSAGNANTTRAGSPAFEPTPPPLRQLSPEWRGTAMNVPHDPKATAPAEQKPAGLSGFMSLLERALKLLHSALGGASTTAEPAKTETTKTSSTKDTDDTKKTSSTKAKDDDDESSTSSKKSSSTKSSSSSSSKNDGPKSMAALNKLSDGDFMEMVRKGKIPEEVLKDPQGMLAIQTRLNHISQMTSLMTNMMQALHDIQMSVVRNVRA